MATLYYRPYTSELEIDDSSSERTYPEDVPPDFEYIFGEDSCDDNEIQDSKPPEDIDKYKLAMRRMSTEIMYLRDQMKHLAVKNSGLRCEECGHDKDPATVLGEALDLDGISKEDLLNKYVTLKSKYDEICLEVEAYQDKVHKFQKELIKKNHQEAEYIKMNKAHSSQNTLLQNLQKRIEKMKQLEETIKTQELIILKMEKQIGKKNEYKPPPVKDKLTPIIEVSSSREIGFNTLLQEENLRLKKEVETLKISQPKTGSFSNMSDSERLELYQLLDRAEQRIMALEKQVSVSHRDLKKEERMTQERDDFGLSKIKF